MNSKQLESAQVRSSAAETLIANRQECGTKNDVQLQSRFIHSNAGNDNEVLKEFLYGDHARVGPSLNKDQRIAKHTQSVQHADLPLNMGHHGHSSFFFI